MSIQMRAGFCHWIRAKAQSTADKQRKVPLGLANSPRPAKSDASQSDG
jgi:hypothetical protein